MQEFVNRLKEVSDFQQKLMAEVVAEGEKFGEDIKHLADFTSGVKKFEPWIEMSEAKKSKGMTKPKNLQEANTYLADAQVRVLQFCLSSPNLDLTVCFYLLRNGWRSARPCTRP